ncbi:hypothetical protein GOP47_0025836 [Adiantum capillus-veneris]|uniref:FAM86 N-terminal domain-containing protein n=1 Tax=Adiantum capillus-veneris TaxID=13818 RepID=A0A9D4U1N2_ADICA|nr:hypothetical protein GOP47_0025836 [Adiantum capillus-veneris]
MEGAQRQLVASFLAMESPTSILRLVREIGNGSVSTMVQDFFNEFCLKNSVVVKFPPSRGYMSNVLKLLILAAESDQQEVLDEFYDQHVAFLHSSENSGQSALEGFHHFTQRCHKSYLYSFSDDAIVKLANYLGEHQASKFKDLVLTIQVSSNMLEGSTGCYAWPAGIFLSEFILANPAIFSGRLCLEVGAGAGLSTICLGLLNASKVIATDGNRSTLANLKHNVAINATLLEEPTSVELHELLWESASEKAVKGFGAEIIVGADLIYDVSCIPYLVRLLAMLLSRGMKHESSCQGKNSSAYGHEYISHTDVVPPIAYIATVIRNVETMDIFVSSACQAGLLVEDVTDTMRPPIFLPQITGIDRTRRHAKLGDSSSGSGWRLEPVPDKQASPPQMPSVDFEPEGDCR